MERDYSALASRVAARAEVLGCLILSRDGLVLGSFPPGGEQDVSPAWLRFSSLGEPLRGFLAFSDQLWAYARHGEYAAFAVAVPSARAGILLDLLEQALMEVHEAHHLREAVRAPEKVNLTYPAPREERVAQRSAEEAAAPVALQLPHRPDPQLAAAVPVAMAPDGGIAPPAPPQPVSPEPAAVDPAGGPQEPNDPPTPEEGRSPEDIDRVALAREFAQLLQENPKAVEEGP
jgi:hypothetical protein